MGQNVRGCAMECLLPHAQISSSSRRRLARWLVGSSIKMVERDMILETLAHTRGNRTVAARLLGVSVRTLRNKIAQYSAEHRTTTNTIGSPPSIGTSPKTGWRRDTAVPTRKIRGRLCLLRSPVCGGQRLRIALCITLMS